MTQSKQTKKVIEKVAGTKKPKMSSPASTLPGGSTTGSESEKDSIQSENNSSKMTPSLSGTGTGGNPGVLFSAQFQQSPSKENDQPLLKQVIHHQDSLENIAEKGSKNDRSQIDLTPMTSAAEAILTESQWEILLQFRKTKF